MISVYATSNANNVSVYRMLNGHTGGRPAHRVNETETTPDASNRTMGQKNAAIRVARQERAQELYEARTERFIPANMAMEQAIQDQMNNPQKRNLTRKLIDDVRDLRGGVYAGPLPASAVAARDRYHQQRMDGYL